MSVAPWRSLLDRALDKNRRLPYARYFQLATIRPNNRPANRTVVFRGFLEDSNQLKIITDFRSQKIAEINRNAWGEACWYFPETREQFRLSGQLTLIGVEDSNLEMQKARLTTWQKLSDAARVQFAWSHPGEERQASDPFSPPIPDSSQPLPNFCLLLLDPQQVDRLELRGDPQNRTLYVCNDGDWSTQAVNP